MKKILAIAVATAISAPAMADMTIGGEAGINFGKSGVASEDGYGFGLEDAVLTVSGSQTFGEMTISAGTSIEVAGKGMITSGNNNVSVAGGFGKLSVAQISTGEGYGVDALTDAVAGGSAASAPTHESVTYTLPSFIEGTTFAINYLDGVGVDADGEFAYGNNAKLSNLDYRVTTTLGGMAVYVGYQPQTERLRSTVSGTFGSVSLAAGVESKPASQRTSLKAALAIDEVSTATVTFATDGTDNGYTFDYDRDLGSNVSLNAGYDNVEGTGSTGASLTFAF